MKDYPKKRTPARIVSCPHCSWKGSARGLYTHCRMGHPKLPMPETRGTRVFTTIHPQTEKPIKRKRERTKSALEMIFELLLVWDKYVRNKTAPTPTIGKIPNKVNKESLL